MTTKVRAWNMGEVRQLVEFYRQGLTQQEMSRRLKRPVCSIYRYLLRYTDFAPLVRLNKDVRQKLRQLSKRGLCQIEIAREIGVSRTTVAVWLKRMPEVKVKDGRRKSKAKSRELRRKLGICRCDYIRQQCSQLGWTEATSITQARILTALKAGPLGRKEICLAIGRKDTCDRDVTKHLRQLEALGMLTVTHRMGPAGNTYTLSARMERNNGH